MTEIRRSEKILARVLWGLAVSPAGSLALFYAFVLRARQVLGRWPSFSDPDPKGLEFTLHHWAWFWSIPAQLAAGTILLILCLTGWFRWPNTRFTIALTAAVYSGSLLGALALYRIDPGGFSEWMMD